MKTLMLALGVLALAALVPGAADAHTGTTDECRIVDTQANLDHVHVCVDSGDLSLPPPDSGAPA